MGTKRQKPKPLPGLASSSAAAVYAKEQKQKQIAAHKPGESSELVELDSGKVIEREVQLDMDYRECAFEGCRQSFKPNPRNRTHNQQLYCHPRCRVAQWMRDHPRMGPDGKPYTPKPRVYKSAQTKIREKVAKRNIQAMADSECRPTTEE